MFRSSPRRSFGYIEATVSVTILSSAVLAALQMMGSYVSGVEIGAETQIARELASELMAEIFSNRFEDRQISGTIGPESGETTRLDFDDVDDYHNWVESVMTDINGNAHPIADTYKLGVRVKVDFVNPTTLRPTPAFTEKVCKCVTVIITNREGKRRFIAYAIRMLYE